MKSSPLAVVVVLAAVAAVACSADASDQTPETASPYVALAECPVTIPATPYVAREPYLAEPPALYNASWFGTDDLWTMLSRDGETWHDLPWDGDSFTQKTWWLSRNFVIREEYQPAITVSGRRLDAPGSSSAGDSATHGFTDFGDAMLVGVDIPSVGCWEIHAEYGGAELAYTVLIE